MEGFAVSKKKNKQKLNWINPKFKSRKHSTPSFFQDNVKIQFTDTHVKVEGFAVSKKKNKQKLNWIKLAECGRIPTKNVKYTNPRIKHDGLNWYITVGVEYEKYTCLPTSEAIGIDLGIKDLAICSDGNTYKNINKTQKVKKLEKRKRRLQRSISRSYEKSKKGESYCKTDNVIKNTYKNINKTQKVKKLEKRKRRLQRSISRSYEKSKKGESYCKTDNVIKKEKKLLRLNRRLTNIRHDHLHKTTSEIIKRKPSFICIEDLNISGMMKNKHLSKVVQQQGFYEFRRQIEYKSAW